MAFFSPDFLHFFKELAANNNKDWFDKNRARYEKEVKLPMQVFVQALITEMGKKDKKIKIGPKEAIFRINRDVRFAKDKSPYKLHTSALISAGGKKDKEAPGMYIELGPEHLRIYMGAYEIETGKLVSLRKYLAKNLTTFNKLVSDKNFKKHFGKIQGEKQVRLPIELKEKALAQPLLANKQFYWGTELKPESVTHKDLLKMVMKNYEVGKPLSDFLAKGLGGK